MCLPMGTMAANWKKRGLRYVAVFWAALQVSAYLRQVGVPEIKSNRSHPLLYRDPVWRTWSIATVLGRLRRSESRQSLPLSSYGNDWFIYIACSRDDPAFVKVRLGVALAGRQYR
jgi:hypothetical protein